jgi:SSS family solute:Na+ symporter
MQARAKKKKSMAHCGVFEWPIMAFMGVILGMLAKVAATQGMFDGVTDAATMDSENCRYF